MASPMELADAMRIADILEADDVISPVAMASRKLVSEVRRLNTVVIALENSILERGESND
jgi:hypothetical protein